MSNQAVIEKFVEKFIPSAVRIENAPWIDELERSVGLSLPKSYKFLLSSFMFDEFETEEVEFFYNLNSSEEYDIKKKIFNDELLFEELTKNGLFHIGFPYIGDYDAVCFDTKNKTNNGDYPIVKVCHESIFQKNEIKVVETIASSFYEYAKSKNS